MGLSSKHKVEASFSMSSMTDMVFLLLIFFMLTSTFVSSSGVNVNLPSAKGTEMKLTKITVTITKDNVYYVNDRQIARSELEATLARELNGVEKGVIALHVDQDVPSQNLVEAAGIAASLKASVSIATKTH